MTLPVAAAADTYQMLAYCTAYGLARGHLVYVTGDDRPVRHVVRNAGTEIVCHSLDLAQPLDDLLAAVAGLAEDICRPAAPIKESWDCFARLIPSTTP